MTFNQKILCVGNETEDTDIKVNQLSQDHNTVNHGVITDTVVVPVHPGYYHTTLADIQPGGIAHIAKNFDEIIMLDQSPESYPHWKSFVGTFRLMYDLEQTGNKVTYRNNEGNKVISYWHDLLRENKSVCFYPFLGLIDNLTSAGVCPKNFDPFTDINSIHDWQVDAKYNVIRNKMLRGELVNEWCEDCYSQESLGQESTRQFETLEWMSRLNFKSINDLADVESPAYYEIRPNNKCNVMCRTCDNARSHLIEKEWKTINIPLLHYKDGNIKFEHVDFNTVKRIYVGGGEPTVMAEFYDFLTKCIKQNRTDFELVIGTNGMKFSDKIMGLFSHFSDVCFSVSFDGYKKVGDYIRWGTDFDTVVKNSHMLLAQGHKVSLQTVFSIYNSTRMHEIFEFYDREFPTSSLLVQYAGFEEDIMNPYNNPCREMVIESMYKCMQTKVYYSNGRSCKTQVDAMLDWYENNYQFDVNKLKKFFEFNDKIDRQRNSLLGNYIPELEQARHLIK
jgi:sulfatase maturation enzyme AslB (radical SAM superfamily)